jgi:hypothetical protein
MTVKRHIALVLFGILTLFGTPAVADDTPAPTGEADQKGSVGSPPITPASFSPFHIGADYFMGASNLPGHRRMPDGIWAGVGPTYPSVTYARWDNGRGTAAKLSLGTGGMYTGSSSALHQPVEAWWQTPAGSLSVTVGKFWVPFALQEWQYETKPGVMLQWAGPIGVTAAVNQNTMTRAANGYLRLSRALGNDCEVGISGAIGRGLSYDSLHDRAWGVDGTFVWRGWQFTTEFLELQHAIGRFGFGFGRLSYEDLGMWRPWVGLYQWNDAVGEFGRMRSTAYALGFQATKFMLIEAGYAATSAKGVTWLQAHFAWEH